MDVGVVLVKENHNSKDDKMKGEEMAKGSTVVEGMPRKKLADISNLPQKNQDVKPTSVSLNTKEYIDKLRQENVTLVKLFADRNKIIQSHVLELEKLRSQCQQVQQKNMELARSNSQMMAELNSNRDRLKVLQHELGCKNGLLKAMKLEIEGKENMARCRILEHEAKITRHGEDGKFLQAHSRDNELGNKGRKRRCKSLDPTIVQPVLTKEKIHKNRKSARSRAGEQDPIDDILGITDYLSSTIDKPVKDEKKFDTRRGGDEKLSQAHSRDNELCNKRKRQCKSLDSTIVQPVQTNERTDKIRLRAGEQAPGDDRFEITNSLCPIMDKPVQDVKQVDETRLCSRRQSTRLKAAEQATTDALSMTSDALHPVMDKLLQAEKKSDNKRRRSRKQSASLKGQEQLQEQIKNLLQTDNAEFSVPPNEIAAETVSAIKDEPEAAFVTSVSETQELRRSSFRPKRQVVEKVQSYKEIPLNVKMRRTQ